jgi:hypothetical protein
MLGMRKNQWLIDFAIFLLASPILIILQAIRLCRKLEVLHKSLMVSVLCRCCGAEISLVGLWECGCGFTYEGHLLRYCPVCRLFPNMIRCYRCGTTEKVGT